tara:strand:- start:83 stop:601 length:519 start_codon:yes stop_codon:yes gene_type:complete
MSAEWYKEQPKNRNFLSPIGFKLKLERFEGVDFFCQSANIPDIQMPFTDVPTRFRNVPIVPGGGVTFGDLSVRFIIDEDLVNYHSIYKWIRQNGRADRDVDTPDEPQYSNGIIEVTTSNMNTNFVVEFVNMFPINLSNIVFDASAGDIEYITADVTFKYQQFNLRNKNSQLL